MAGWHEFALRVETDEQMLVAEIGGSMPTTCRLFDIVMHESRGLLDGIGIRGQRAEPLAEGRR